MRIKLTKRAKVGTITREKGWSDEVEDSLGQSIINNNRAVLISAPAKKKTAKKKAQQASPPEDD